MGRLNFILKWCSIAIIFIIILRELYNPFNVKIRIKNTFSKNKFFVYFLVIFKRRNLILKKNFLFAYFIH